MISHDLSAVGFDAPTFAELADLVAMQGPLMFEDPETAYQLLVYNDPSGARILIAVNDYEVDLYPSFTVGTAFWPAEVEMIDDFSAFVQVYGRDGSRQLAFTALVDEPFSFPFIESSAIVAECSGFYHDVRVAALATDVDVYPSLEVWRGTRTSVFEVIDTAGTPLTVDPTAGFLYSPQVEQFLGGALPDDRRAGVWIAMQIASVDSRINQLTGLGFHVVTGHIEGCVSPLEMCIAAETAPTIEVGTVVEGVALMIVNNGLWDAARTHTPELGGRDRE